MDQPSLFPDQLPTLRRAKPSNHNVSHLSVSTDPPDPNANQLSFLSPFEGVDIDRANSEVLENYLAHVKTLIRVKRNLERALDEGDNEAYSQLINSETGREAREANAQQLKLLETELETKAKSARVINEVAA